MMAGKIVWRYRQIRDLLECDSFCSLCVTKDSGTRQEAFVQSLWDASSLCVRLPVVSDTGIRHDKIDSNSKLMSAGGIGSIV